MLLAPRDPQSKFLYKKLSIVNNGNQSSITMISLVPLPLPLGLMAKDRPGRRPRVLSQGPFPAPDEHGWLHTQAASHAGSHSSHAEEHLAPGRPGRLISPR